MRLTLVFSGEIQVNIRFLISLKAQEGFKGNVKPVLHKRLAAVRAKLIRHVTARITGIGSYLRGIKVVIVTIGTAIMGT